MGKTISVIFAVLLCAALLAGCGKSAQPAPQATEAPAAEPEEIPVSELPLLGGWTAAESYEMTDELKAVFDKAMEGLVGVNYEPVAYLASQLVSGTNHAVFCSARVVRPDAKPYYAVVYIYQDLQGNVKINDIKAMTPNGELKDDAGSAETLAGGWSVPESEEAGLEAVRQAAQKLLGVDYTPIKVLGEQVVSGRNYCVLCQSKTVTPDAKPGYCLVTVYQDLSGNVQVTDVASLGA